MESGYESADSSFRHSAISFSRTPGLLEACEGRIGGSVCTQKGGSRWQRWLGSIVISTDQRKQMLSALYIHLEADVSKTDHVPSRTAAGKSWHPSVKLHGT